MNGAYSTTSPRSEKFVNLVGDLQTDFKTLINKEIALAKAEMGGKFSALGRNAAFAALGGIIGLMATFVLILGVGVLIAELLESTDLSPGTCYFLSFTGLALLLGGASYALIHKAIAAFKTMSLAPETALASLQAAEPVPDQLVNKIKEANVLPKPSIDELKGEVIGARTRMDDKISELMTRLTPGYAAKSLFSRLKQYPLGALLVSAATTGIGGYIYYRKQQRLAAAKKHASELRRWWSVKSSRA